MPKAAICFILTILAGTCLSSSSFSQAPAADGYTYRGDINEDGQVNIFDLLELLKILASPSGKTERTLQITDVDASGSVNIFDLLGLLKVLAGIEQPEVIYFKSAISGRILLRDRGCSGVAVNVNGNGESTNLITDSDGNYRISGLDDGIYTLTPVKTGYTFSPASFQIRISGNNVSVGDITAVVNNISPGDTVVVHDITFVSIPGGTFQMGQSILAEPVHNVTVSAFQMSIKEITNSQYAAYLNKALADGEINATTSSVTEFTGTSYGGNEYIYLSGNDESSKCWISYNGNGFIVTAGKENWPVVYVTWYGAKAFALKNGFDLPTEAEWEYASRGGKQYAYGTDDGTKSTAKANYEYSVGFPKDVGSYPKNPFGLYDLMGNVWEWCNDWYEKYSSASQTDPVGPESDSFRVTRGGGFSTIDFFCQSAFRDYQRPDASTNYLGFRVVRRTGDTTQPTHDTSLYHYELIPANPTVEPGNSFTARYQINNPISVAIQVKLDLLYHTISGEYGEFEPMDISLTVQPGTAWYERTCLVPAGLTVGALDVAWYLLKTDNTTITSTSYVADKVTVISGNLNPGDTMVARGITFVSIPSGTFQMGYPGFLGLGPQVTVSAFQMSRYEITNAQYAAYLNAALAEGEITATASSVKGAKGDYSRQEYIDLSGSYTVNNKCWISFNGTSFSATQGKEKWPVVYVTWFGAKAFAVRYGFDLPREAEWEYVARGGKQYDYGTNDGTLNSANANFGKNVGYPVDVGSYPSNPFGLCDLAGNAFEWCNDWYGSYSKASQTDPTGPSSGETRVDRGGSWYYDNTYCYSYMLGSSSPYYLYSDHGFRVVRR